MTLRGSGLAAGSRVTALDDVPLLEGLSAGEMAVLDGLLEERSYPQDVEIIQEEQPGEVVYIVVTGSVKIHLEQSDGTEVILAILSADEVVGEMSLVDSLSRSATVATLEPTTVLAMSRESFHQCLDAFPRMAYNLQGLLSRRLRLANTHIEALASLDVAGRVARHLLALAVEYGHEVPEGTVIPIPLVQSDLAALVGASRVRVNQILGNFRRRRYISVDRFLHLITVLEHEALRKRCR